MDDKKIKDILKKDHSGPDAPLGEWNKIEAHIKDSPRLTLGFYFKTTGTLFVLFVALFMTYNSTNEQKKIENYADLNEYYFEDLYLEESFDLYSWVDG